MSIPLVEVCFIVCMLALIAIGFYCSHRLDAKHPFWVRLIVLLPCLTAFATLAAIPIGAYAAFWPDVGRAVSSMLVYALVASRFSSRPWLDIRTTKD
jgi:hypothetical protein